ncbi:hypothetical protein GOP47_0018286 [Adiantum capillus-veneris]|uniref:Uncharacterized protein n=1 Tax=Adiantum capillus-veneris TaxID=13818 RepID=A0A9D4UHZ2_ADICA|nr:hypothetical protein GOP47_0018286 [Adiantum capillus-veneris]
MKEVSTANQEMNDDNTLVIIDTSWFCNKLVGTLLGTHLKDEPRRPCPWVWDIEDIKKMLRQQGCEERDLDEILRYLQCLELCTTLDIVPGHPKGHLLFPALVKQNVIQYPVVTNANNAMATAFFGRRLRCVDSSIHLIPFGVFTRLQVKLHKEYSNNPTFHLGYGWVSFMRGNVGVVVRFGGENKQYIDILVFCPNSGMHNSASGSAPTASMIMSMSTPSYIAGNKLMDDIRGTCKSTVFGGIPAVILEECVLQSQIESDAPAVLLSDVLEKVRKEGLQGSYQEWRLHIPSTPTIDLLLPRERERERERGLCERSAQCSRRNRRRVLTVRPRGW